MINVAVKVVIWLQATISFAKIILVPIQPGTETLGRLPGSDMFGDVNQYPMAVKTPGVLIMRLKSALLCFANANFVRERIMKWVIEEEKDSKLGNAEKTIQIVILDISNVMDIDTSGIASLGELHMNLDSNGIKLAIANPRWQVIHKLKLANFVPRIGGRVFLSI